MIRICFLSLLLVELAYTHDLWVPQNEASAPPMGWVSWNRYECQRDCVNAPDTCIGERLAKHISDSMIKFGLRDAGYRYLVLSDCWDSGSRNPKTHEYMVSDKQFPQGVLSVSRSLRERNFSLGLFFKEPCDNQYTIEADANTAVKYELDLLAIQACYIHQFAAIAEKMRQSNLFPITGCADGEAEHLFNASPERINWESILRGCRTWRFIPITTRGWSAVLEATSRWRSNSLHQKYCGPNHWCDLGTLGFGYVQMTYEEQRSQMAMWCMIAAPLFISMDFIKTDPFTLELLKNRRLIDINQDPKGQPARFIKILNGIQYWTRELSHPEKSWAIAILNENNGRMTVPIRLVDMGIPGVAGNVVKYTLMDVFSGNQLGPFEHTQEISLNLNAHDTQMFRVNFHLSSQPK